MESGHVLSWIQPNYERIDRIDNGEMIDGEFKT